MNTSQEVLAHWFWFSTYQSRANAFIETYLD